MKFASFTDVLRFAGCEAGMQQNGAGPSALGFLSLRVLVPVLMHKDDSRSVLTIFDGFH